LIKEISKLNEYNKKIKQLDDIPYIKKMSVLLFDKYIEK